MSPSCVALVAVILASAAPVAAGETLEVAEPDALALGAFPSAEFEALLLEALPPPPTIVVRTTRYYGTVTVDHVKHLARRAPCKTCHGPGVVSKLTFTPKIAHGRCIGCHEEQAKGPTKCAGCHVRPPPAELVATATAPVEPPEPNPANVAAALAAFDAPRRGAGGGATGEDPFRRALEVGLVAGSGMGVSVRLASHQDFKVFTQSVERMTSDDEARTFGFVGAGLMRPLRPRVSVEALALAGFDVVDRPMVALLPAVGARAGVEWRPPLRFLRQVSLSVTAVVDLTRRRTPADEVGGASVYATLATGFAIPSK